MKLKEIIKYFSRYEKITLSYRNENEPKFEGIVLELCDGTIMHDKLLNSKIVKIGATLFNLCIELKKGEKIRL